MSTPSDDARTPRFEGSHSFLICTLANHINVVAERFLRKNLNLSLMEWRVLLVLAVEPAATPGRIVTLAAVNKAAVSRAVNALERRGLLERRPVDDRRKRRLLHLTPAGKALHDEGTGSRRSFEEEMLGGLSPAERAQFHMLLKRALGNLDGGAAAPLEDEAEAA